MTIVNLIYIDLPLGHFIPIETEAKSVMGPKPVCGDFSMTRSRGSTLRTSTNPMGSGVGKTGQRNIMVGRVCILLVLALAKQVWWCMEQPKGSLLEGHLLFQAMLKLKHTAVSRVTCSLGWFGADTLKPVWIYSSVFGKDCF